MSKVFVVRFYESKRFKIEDRVLTEVYDDEDDMEVCEILSSLDMHTCELFATSHRKKLMRYLKKGNLMKYYKTIEKIARKGRIIHGG